MLILLETVSQNSLLPVLSFDWYSLSPSISSSTLLTVWWFKTFLEVQDNNEVKNI